MSVDRLAVNASDPTADGPLVAWHEPGSLGLLVQDGYAARVGGTHPALGGGRLAVLRDGLIDVRQTSGPAFAATVPAPGADTLAVSEAWVAWRVREGERDAIYAAPLAGGAAVTVMHATELGRPALDGDRLAFHAAGRSGGRILLAELGRGRTVTVRRERRALLLNPSLLGGQLLYVRAVYSRQELRVGPASRRTPRRDRRIWSTVPTGRRDAGHEPGDRHQRHGHPHKLWRRPRPGVSATLWTTALAEDAAYVTRLRQAAGKPLYAEILRVGR
jgi:hypothetical protein